MANPQLDFIPHDKRSSPCFDKGMRLRLFTLILILLVGLKLHADDEPLTEESKDIAKSATCGAGFGAGRNMCYRGVKAIIASGLGINLACARGIMKGGSAIDAMTELPELGFINRGSDSPSCKAPGTVRVYQGIASKMSHDAAEKLVMSRFGLHHNQGDISGHIEVVGEDKGYYSFFRAYRPISENNNVEVKLRNGQHVKPTHMMAQRRTLVGCFVVNDSEKAHGTCKSGPSCQSRKRKTKKAQPQGTTR